MPENEHQICSMVRSILEEDGVIDNNVNNQQHSRLGTGANPKSPGWNHCGLHLCSVLDLQGAAHISTQNDQCKKEGY